MNFEQSAFAWAMIMVVLIIGFGAITEKLDRIINIISKQNKD